MDFINTVYNEIIRPLIESVFTSAYTFKDPESRWTVTKRIPIISRLKEIDELVLCKKRIQQLLVEAKADVKETPKRRNWLTYRIECVDSKIQQHIDLL